jgi:hypothetical protein
LILAVVGVAAVLGIAGLVVVLTGGEDEPAPPPAQPNGGPGRSGGGEPIVGDLKGLIEERVGPYTLVGTTQNREAISDGALDAYVAEYEGSGTQLRHELMAFNSGEQALSNDEALIERLQEAGFDITNSAPLTNENEEHVGALTVLLNEQDGVEQWVWLRQDLGLVLTASSSRGEVKPFYDEVPY